MVRGTSPSDVSVCDEGGRGNRGVTTVHGASTRGVWTEWQWDQDSGDTAACGGKEIGDYAIAEDASDDPMIFRSIDINFPNISNRIFFKLTKV